MMQLLLIAAAECGLLDQGTNKVSLVNIWDRMDVPGFPTILPQLSLVVIATRGDAPNERFVGQIVIALDDEAIVTEPLEIDFQQAQVARTFLSFVGFPVARPGTLSFRVLDATAHELGRYQIRVMGIPQPERRIAAPNAAGATATVPAVGGV